MKIFSKQKDEDFIIEEPENIMINNFGKNTQVVLHELTAEEILNSNQAAQPRFDGQSALKSLKQKMMSANVTTETAKPDNPSSKLNEAKEIQTKPSEKPKTLLEKCKPFTTDDNGNDASKNSVPLYKLESVAEILKTNSQKTVDILTERYSLTIDDLGKTDTYIKELTHEETNEKNTATNETIEINTFLSKVQSSISFPYSETESEIYNKEQNNFENTGTITFTPVTTAKNSKPKIIVTSNTQNIDLTGEIIPVEDIHSSSDFDNVTLEKSEFEEFLPKNEIENHKDIKKHLRLLAIKKRTRFLTLAFSVILTLSLAFFKLPFMTGFILGQTKVSSIIFTVIAFIATLLNIDIFLSIPNMFTKKATADSCTAITSVLVIAYAITGIITGEIIIDMLLLLCVVLSMRAFNVFFKASYMLSNLKQIAFPGTKNALRLIDEPAITFALAKNSIEGDTLIATRQSCNHIKDFIKYSTFGYFLNGKLPIISILSLLLSAIVGFATAIYYNGILSGLYAAAAIHCFTVLPSIFFINDLPIYSAAKKLNKKGCMIAGQMGAQHIEMANALVLNSSDIFPSGTVTLHQMKILSENSLDDTIIRAASLTQSLNSTLAPIFKQIAGESDISTLPDSDTIKYEEKMGISGWVDDKLLFIGNRTLMEAHGINVPDIEVDRKILRNGYFPVYVASDNKACALLMVQYSVDPNISHELRNLTKIGVTILVNNTDPNINNQMICDYLGLYDDSVMIISNAGYHMLKNSTEKKEYCSAPASFRYNNISIANIINCANKIRRSNILLTILYVISAILGVAIFVYSSFAGSGTLISSTTILLYSIICSLITYLLYLSQKP